MSKEELQAKYIELKMLEQQTSQIQQQLLILENQLSMLSRTKQSIEEISAISPGTAAFIPLGQGVFAKGEIKDTKTLLVGVGSNVAVAKTVKESNEIVEKQISEVKSIISQFEAQIQQANMHARILEEEMQALAAKEQQS